MKNECRSEPSERRLKPSTSYSGSTMCAPDASHDGLQTGASLVLTHRIALTGSEPLSKFLQITLARLQSEFGTLTKAQITLYSTGEGGLEIWLAVPA
jgi:hypothetical protein